SKNVVVLARDRCGQKPLFYFYNGNSLFFASELKAFTRIQDLPRKISASGLDQYLGYGFVSASDCILEGYKKLEAATAMVFDLHDGNLSAESFWTPPAYQTTSKVFDSIELLNELEKLFEASISRHLVSDVPVGVLLSGGLDSSLITAFAHKKIDKLKTFTVSIPGNSKYDEAIYARQISDFFGTEHYELEASDSAHNLLPKLAWQFDEPIADSSIIPMALVSEAVSGHCKVALGGDGGDELFGGYDHYQRLIVLKKLSKLAPIQLRILIARFSERALPLGFKNSNLRTWIMAFGSNFEKELPLVANIFDTFSRKKLLGGFDQNIEFIEDIKKFETGLEGDLLSCSTAWDFQHYLIDDLLVKVDRASMMHSLEVRAPFLDNDLIDFAFNSIPPNEKVTQSNKKIILKKLAAKVLPKNYDFKRKQGFSVPLADWFKKGTFRDMTTDILTSEDCIFDKKTVLQLIEGQDANRNNSERLFSLLNFELWKQSHDVKI
ncbi:asparagine synthase (glutamine-hydrolyzing), partial [Paracoccaceae bacterium]|nr:asparagine synthase (glutamine-hydrolyzing) [Paracoccaceae bacterium]